MKEFEFKVTNKNKMEIAIQILALPKESLIRFQNGLEMHGVYVKRYHANAHRPAFDKIQYFDNMGKKFGVDSEDSGHYSIEDFAKTLYVLSHNKRYTNQKYWEL